jgi:hypothetical protein
MRFKGSEQLHLIRDHRKSFIVHPSHLGFQKDMSLRSLKKATKLFKKILKSKEKLNLQIKWQEIMPCMINLIKMMCLLCKRDWANKSSTFLITFQTA